jgi:hypothetical protein
MWWMFRALQKRGQLAMFNTWEKGSLDGKYDSNIEGFLLFKKLTTIADNCQGK